MRVNHCGGTAGWFGLSLCLASTQALPQARADLARTPLARATVVAVGRDLDLGVVLAGALTRSGDVLLIEQGRAAVRRINRLGRVTVEYGRPGAGPGEHRFPYRVMELDDGAVIVYDLSLQAFSEYRPAGQFVRRWYLSSPLQSLDDLVPLPGRRFALSGVLEGTAATGHAVHVFDSAFVRRRSFGALPPSRSPSLRAQWGAGALVRARSGNVVFSRRLPYELTEFTELGQVMWSQRINRRVSRGAEDALAVETSGQQTTVRARTDVAYPAGLTPLKGGGWLSVRVVDGARWWDEIDKERRLRRTVAAPSWLSFCIGADPETGVGWWVGTEDDLPILWWISPAGDSA